MTSVLRLGHRPERDKRLTTHVALTARALGAERMYIPSKDSRIKESIEGVNQRFGGRFDVEYVGDWREVIKGWKGEVVHLSMYGTDIDTFFEKVELENPLIVVGAEKVPGDVYELADHNVAVGNQPHSEVAALAVFMDRMNQRAMPKNFDGAKMGILSASGGKRVIDYERIPNLSTCYRFCLERGMDRDLLEHTFKVLQRALELHEKFDGDLKLLLAGSMLHDIGRTVTHGVEHGVVGGEIVRDQGWDEHLARIVECHIGGGISKREAEDLQLPFRSYIPDTLEEKIVCHADNTAGEGRFDELVDRTEDAGHTDSVERMKKLKKEFG